MRYVLVGRDWRAGRDRFLMKIQPFTLHRQNATFTDDLLEALIYKEASLAAYIMHSDIMSHHRLRIKQITDKEWFEAKLKG